LIFVNQFLIIFIAFIVEYCLLLLYNKKERGYWDNNCFWFKTGRGLQSSSWIIKDYLKL